MKSIIYALIPMLVESSLVTLDQGIVEGVHLKSHHEKDISSFQGIPYGAPPVGDRRFRLPEPAGGWEGVLLANDMVECPQFEDFKMIDTTMKGQEDCLQLSVHVTQVYNITYSS